MVAAPVEQLTSPVAAQIRNNRERYDAIRKQRNRILTQAVIQTTQFMIKNCAKNLGHSAGLMPDHQTVVATLENCLDESSLTKTDQQLVILLGMGIQFKAGFAPGENMVELYQKEKRGVDMNVILRLGRSLHRDPVQKALLWRFIHQKAAAANQHTPLIEAYIEGLLDDIPMSQVDTAMSKTFVSV